ncbi:alpha/beta fold hydrolase [Streptomyces sp. PSAA01]|uniref:alpha/beta fold hydrolase n=1 Tax=Streptomyces sp. PSAA01 TaxID=2912762 RepID=UPI0035AC1DA6
MPQVRAAGVNLHYQAVGDGTPLVLVHASWNDHTSWQSAIEAHLSASFTVVSYDRRGHGRSEQVPGQGTRRQDEDDLAALIEGLGHAPPHVAGSPSARRSSSAWPPAGPSCSAASRCTSHHWSGSWPTTRRPWHGCGRPWPPSMP